jgi:hypothetical protein
MFPVYKKLADKAVDMKNNQLANVAGDTLLYHYVLLWICVESSD